MSRHLSTRYGVLLTVLIVAGAAKPVHAQWVVTPYLGMTLAGDAEFRRGGPGGSVAYLGGRLGVELDVQRYHHFFKDKNVDIIPNNCLPDNHQLPCIDLNTDALSLMGRLVARLPEGRRWRPYGSVGIGVIHPWIEGPGDHYDVSQNNPALDLGGGMIASLSTHVGLRGDLRYFRAFVDESKRGGAYFRDYGFLRVVLGVAVGLPTIR